MRMFSMIPPRPRRDLKRRPRSVPWKTQLLMATFLMFPVISLPHTIPPCPYHGTIRDGQILTGSTVARPDAVLSARLDGDAVVTDIDMTVGDVNMSAGIWVDSVRIGRFARIPDGHAMDHYIVATDRVDGPFRRIYGGNPVDEKIRASTGGD